MALKKYLIIGFLFICSLAAQAQTTLIASIMSGGTPRSYRLYIPAAYAPGMQWPLVIDMHGYTSSAFTEQSNTKFMSVADTGHFLVVYPEGVKDQNNSRYWNVGLPYLPNAKNDVSFLSELIDTLHLRYQLDCTKVYATGISMGTSMAYLLAEKLGNRIAAVGGEAGAMYYHSFNQVNPTFPMPIMHIHGTADQVVLYNGEHVQYGNIPIDTLVNFWGLNAGCNPVPTIDTLPHQAATTNRTRVVHYEFLNGSTGMSCRLYKLLNGVHGEWPGVLNGTLNNKDFNASSTMWIFFKQYARPEALAVKQALTKASIVLYPNPSGGRFNVLIGSYSAEIADDIEVITLWGKRMLHAHNEASFDASEWSAGVYMVKVISGELGSISFLIRQ